MKMDKIKTLLGDEYQFKKHLTDEQAALLVNDPPDGFANCTAASLTAGCVRIDAVIFRTGNAAQFGYNVLVKDAPDAPEWVCYDSPEDEVRLDEAGMLSVLDRVVGRDGLSYTECCFEQLEGKHVKKEQDGSVMQL